MGRKISRTGITNRPSGPGSKLMSALRSTRPDAHAQANPSDGLPSGEIVNLTPSRGSDSAGSSGNMPGKLDTMNGIARSGSMLEGRSDRLGAQATRTRTAERFPDTPEATSAQAGRAVRVR